MCECIIHYSYTCSVYPNMDDEQARCCRHTIARYVNLTAALAWREISVKVRSRFPLTETLVASGLMTTDEERIYEQTAVSGD